LPPPRLPRLHPAALRLPRLATARGVAPPAKALVETIAGPVVVVVAAAVEVAGAGSASCAPTT